MKRLFLILLTTVCASSAFAQLGGDGYYRVKSAKQGRYVSLVDNRGSVNVSTTSADMSALRTIYGFSRVVSDPSTVIYIMKYGDGYDLRSQGTGSYDIVSYALKIMEVEEGIYWAWATKAGMSRYLADETISWMWGESDPRRIYGNMTNIEVPKADEADWNIIPVSQAEGCYFGITPDVTVGDSYYKSFYAAFSFAFGSAGMNAYYISKVDEKKKAAVIKELTFGVPSKTPVIVKCSSTDPANNKLIVGATTSGAASGNLLKGVFFCNDVSNTSHRNVVDYKASTMRVLGTASDGSLAFVKSSTLKYIPANTAYINVTADAPDELKIYTQEEYDALPDGIFGDLNGDEKLDSKDVDLMVSYILKKESFDSAADLNSDGKIDVLDMGILVKEILKK